MKTVVILGPESTGKTKLAQELAKTFNCGWVPEFARGYLDRQGSAYKEEDLLEIAKGQAQCEQEASAGLGDVVFFDTDLTVIKIWSLYKYGRCHRWILRELEQYTYDLYLLTYPDLPWTPDPLREHPQQREELYSLFLEDLKKRKLPFTIIKGQGSSRLKQAVSAVRELLTTG